MVLGPSAASAARSIAIPARISGDSTVPPLSGDGPEITARCGSHSTMRAPMPMSLSTKNSRDSNIFSKTRIIPAHCVAATIVVDMTSAGNAGHGPSSSLGTWPPRSDRMDGDGAVGDRREPDEAPDLDVIRSDRVRGTVERPSALHGVDVGSDALDVGPHR